MIRRLISILAMALVLYVVGFFVFEEKNGRVIYSLDDEHGIHTGDLLAIVIGGVACGLLLWRLAVRKS